MKHATLDCQEYLIVLSVSLCPVVCLAKHLAVLNACCAAFAPCRDVVGIHFGELPHLLATCFMSDGTERAVACVVECSLSRLLLIDFTLGSLIKDADVK